MGDLRYCPARMYEYACELRYDHDGDHRQGHVTWERLAPGAPKAETAQRCVICHGSGWTGSRHASDGSEHYHCPCGAPCGVDRAEGCSGGVRRRTKAEQRACSQDGCRGDGRYQPPGRGHRHGCEHDAWTWVWGTFPDVVQPPGVSSGGAAE